MPFWQSVEAVKTVSDLYMPVGGKVIEVNKSPRRQSRKSEFRSFGDGWMIKIEVANPADVAKLLTAAQYKELMAK